MQFTDRFIRQVAFEAEGAKAAITGGKTRADCPYPEEDKEAWNFWVYGNENAQSELRILKEGFKVFTCSTAEHVNLEKELAAAPVISAYEAVARGLWKPKYVTVAQSSTVGTSS